MTVKRHTTLPTTTPENPRQPEENIMVPFTVALEHIGLEKLLFIARHVVQEDLLRVFDTFNVWLNMDEETYLGVMEGFSQLQNESLILSSFVVISKFAILLQRIGRPITLNSTASFTNKLIMMEFLANNYT